MGKRVLLVILLLCMAVLSGCDSKEAGDTMEEQAEYPETESPVKIEDLWQTSREIRDIREKYPEYFELNTFNEIDLYVWQVSEDSYCCGMLGGTNRNKTDKEIWELFNKSVTPEEVRLILSACPEDAYVAIIPVVQPLSSYTYEINDSYRKKVNEVFGAENSCTTVGELTK